MQVSKDRILTTHVGSLPRSQAVVDVVFGREQGDETDRNAGDAVIASAINADQVRLHVCWGNYEGPHNHDVPMELVLPIWSAVNA